MENASKALIIAGGILIAIALISLALYLFANARGLVDISNTALEKSQIESFNRFYFSYAPSFDSTYSLSGLDAYNVIRKIQNDNNSETAFSEIKKTMKGVSEDEIKDSANYFENGYKITVKDNNGDTAIDEIIISK